MSLDNMPGWVNVIYDIAYSFHMPLFFFISGYLFFLTRLNVSEKKGREWNYRSIMFDKLQRLGIPFLVFTVFAMALKTAFASDMARPAEFTVREFLLAIVYPNKGPLLEMWFVAVLLWMFALTPLWKWVLKSGHRIFAAFAICLTFRLLSLDAELFCIGKTLYYSVFFLSGMLFNRFRLVESVNDCKVWYMVSGFAFWCFGMTMNFPLIGTGGGILFSIALSLALDRCLPGIFSSFRNYTYQIFLIGIFAQIAVKMLYRRVDIPYLPAFIVCTLAGLYVPVIISRILEYINWGPLLVCVGLKKTSGYGK